MTELHWQVSSKLSYQSLIFKSGLACSVITIKGSGLPLDVLKLFSV